MKAVVYDRGNSPDILTVREVEKPVPQDNEVLVKIHIVPGYLLLGLVLKFVQNQLKFLFGFVTKKPPNNHKEK